MEIIEFFKLQAKNFYKDFKTQYLDEEQIYQYKPKFFKDIDDIILSFDIDEEDFSLMKAQHYISLLAGFKNWHDLVHSDEDGLELGKLLFEHRNDTIDRDDLWMHWDNYLLMNNFINKDNSFKLQLFKILYLNEEN